MLHEHNKPHGQKGPATPMPHALLPSGELPRAGGTTSKGRVQKLAWLVSTNNSQLPSKSMLMPSITQH